VHDLHQTYHRLKNHSIVLQGHEAQVEARIGLFGDSCTVCVERTTAQKSFWTHPMELLDDVRHVESRFGLFGDSASVSARHVHDLHQTYHRLRIHFGSTRWNSKVMWSCEISFRTVWRQS
jgi:hypothetical protein